MTTHESFEQNEAPLPPSERSFAWVFATFFLVLALWPVWRGRPLRWWAIAVAALVFLTGLVQPAALRLPNLIWFRLGNLLSRITSPLVMSILFFAVFTPIAALMRMTGKDPLRLRRDGGSDSYWIKRNPPGPPPASMVEQF